MAKLFPPKWARCRRANSSSGWTLSLKDLSAELLALGFTPVVATEIEFYLPLSLRSAKLDGIPLPLREGFSPCGENSASDTNPSSGTSCHLLPQGEKEVSKLDCFAFARNDGKIHKIEKERGLGQYEISLKPVRDAVLAAEQLNVLKAALTEADFRAKPFADQPGSGLHVHVHLEDASGANVFLKNDDEMSDALKWSLGGLLATLQKNMDVFAPTAESRTRFQGGSNAPTTLSWGANNRTVALRLPDSGCDQKWIEHRVAGADADAEAVIAAVLEGILFGLKNHSDPGAQVFGDASLAMYGLQKLL